MKAKVNEVKPAATQRAKPRPFSYQSEKAHQASVASVLGDRSATMDNLGLQAELKVNTGGDRWEREAQSVARQVTTRSQESNPQISPKPTSLQKESQPGSSNGSPIGAAPQRKVQQALARPGTGMDRDTRETMESKFGRDFSNVRIHTDSTAARSADAIQANAYTKGDHIFFGENQYQPASRKGRTLLAHELTHVLQQGGSKNTMIQRDDPPTSSERTPPPRVALAFSLSGIHLAPSEEAVFEQGVPLREQYIRMLAAKLVRPADFSEDLVERLHRHLLGSQYFVTFQPAEEGTTAIRPINISLPISFEALNWLYQELKSSDNQDPLEVLRITRAQLDLILLGSEIDFIWQQIHQPEIASEIGAIFPDWYTIHFFRQDMGHRNTVLQQARSERLSEGEISNLLLFILAEAAMESAYLMEAFREYQPLHGDPLFRRMWNLPELENEDAEVSAPGPAQTPNLGAIGLFVSFAHSQPALMEQVVMGAEADPDPRFALWERFIRFNGRTSATSGEVRDQVLSDGFSDRNAEPLPSSLTAIPALTPPFFDLATDNDHAFSMDVSFSDKFEALSHAFGGFNYIFEIIRVENDSLDNVEESAAAGEGDVAGWEDVWDARMRRQARYFGADMDTTAEAMMIGYSEEEKGVTQTLARLNFHLGPQGSGVTNLVAMGAALRTVGEVISTVFLMLSTPRYERRLVFPNDGLYVVRAICTPSLDDDSEYRRAPSIAWLPVWARSPAAMSRLRSEQNVRQLIAQELALADALSSNECTPDMLSPEDLGTLRTSLYGDAGELLTLQRSQLEARRTEISGMEDSEMPLAERQAAIRQIDQRITSINNRLGTRTSRGNHGNSTRIVASFVSDTGVTIQPLIEATDVDASDERYRYYVSDLTKDDAGDVTGSTATDRNRALLDALEKLFEQSTGYGRGNLTVYIPEEPDGFSHPDQFSNGSTHTIRIEAAFDAIVMESVESVTTLISVAAMVAAPFTGGASLAILLPVGIIGSVPAAYRVGTRLESSTFRWDMQTAMDLVDIIGSFLSGGEAVSGGLRLFRTAKFLGVMGSGLDGLSILAVNWQTIRALQSLPPGLSEGERRLAIMRTLGGALQANGMAVGGRMLAQAGDGVRADLPDVPRTDTSTPEASTRAADSPRVEADLPPTEVTPAPQTEVPTRTSVEGGSSSPRPETSRRPQRTPALESPRPASSAETAGAIPGSNFHGNGRAQSEPEAVAAQAREVMGEVATRLNMEIQPDGSVTFTNPEGVRITIHTETEAPIHGNQSQVARFIREREGAYDIHLSDRPNNEDIARALTHELAEIRAIEAGVPISHRSSLVPGSSRSELTANDHGRLAEIAFLDSQIQAAGNDPQTRQRLQGELENLLLDMGMVYGRHSETRREMMSSALGDPDLSARLAATMEHIGPDPRYALDPDSPVGDPLTQARHRQRFGDRERYMSWEDFQFAYAALNKKTTLTPEQLWAHWVAGRVPGTSDSQPANGLWLNGFGSGRQTGQLYNPDSGGATTPGYEASLTDYTQVAGAPVPAGTTDPLIAQRDRAQQIRDRFQHSAEWSADRFPEISQRLADAGRVYGALMNRASEALGEAAARSFGQARAEALAQSLGGNRTVIEEPAVRTGAGSFDIVFRVSGTPEHFIVIEAKGGTSDLGNRDGVGTATGARVQQGSRAYLDSLLAFMTSSSRRPAEQSLGGKIQDALRNSNLEYFVVTQPIIQNGGTTTLGAPTVRQANIY
ncbi:DUF4157 domain-containing protein [Haloferula chungangensis]|uniref:DUF4157 domain-containing protein n=1 Tax=Haloferula chungangensis TaxID=1048331 RepID=A0ABW2L0F8_9BACT